MIRFPPLPAPTLQIYLILIIYLVAGELGHVTLVLSLSSVLDNLRQNQLLSGTRHLKSLNYQRLQADNSTQDCTDQIEQLVTCFQKAAKPK